MRIVKLLIGAAVAMALVAAGFAHASVENSGTTAANFLTVGAGTRTLSMGGAALGLGDELGTVSWNAASLGWLNQTEFVLSHAGLSNESAQEWAAVGGRFGSSSTRWSLSGLYQGDGSLEGRDASNNPTGTFGVSSMAFGAHLAHQFGEVLTIGAGAKSVNEKLGDVTGSGLTFDLGFMLRTGRFGMGGAAQNLLGQMKYEGIPYEFPTNYGLGMGVMIPEAGLRLGVDMNFPTAYYWDVRAGAEWLWRDMVALRAGYRQECGSYQDPLTGPTFGVGAGKNGLWMDYGYLLSSSGESQHRLGLRLLPGGFGSITGLGPFASAQPSATKPPAEKKAAKPSSPKPAKTSAVPQTASKAPASTAEPSSKNASATKAASEAAATAPVASAVDPRVIPVKKVATPTFPPIKPAPPVPVKVAAKPSEQLAMNVPPPAPKAEPVVSKPAPPEPEPTQVETVTERPKKIRVVKGDTLASIGRRYKVSVPAIMMDNNLVNDEIQIGQTLKLPAEGR